MTHTTTPPNGGELAAHLGGAASLTIDVKGMPAPITQQLLTLERERDQLADRIVRLTSETRRDIVEGFQYHDESQAIRVRGRLLCSLLRRLDAVNAGICRIIAPGFAATPGEGFSERVMRDLSA